jgi:hypothetical protein
VQTPAGIIAIRADGHGTRRASGGRVRRTFSLAGLWLAALGGACSGRAGDGDRSADAGGLVEIPDAAPPGESDAGLLEDYPTPTPVMRFDLAGFLCPSAGVCEPQKDQCFCQAELDHLNYTSQSHFLVVATEAHRDDIRSVGNYQAYYINSLNYNAAGMGWRYVTPEARADEMVARCEEDFPTICPKWVLVNEISSSVWPADQAYRTWVIRVARRLRARGKEPVMFAPFATVGRNGDDWQALALSAHIGVENYLSGAEIKAHGFSQAWCRSQYQASIDAYGARGVPKSRLFLTEHFASNTADKGWGRAGVPDDDWRRAIQVRSAAARELHFPGFVSYCWACNGMHEDIATRLTYEDLYGSLTLP